MRDRHENDQEDGDRLLAFTVEIVTAHIGNNSVGMSDVPAFISNVHKALLAVDGAGAPAEEDNVAHPIMDPRKAIKPDSVTCLICGKKCKTLTRHLELIHGLSPDLYRARFDLPKTYPLVAKVFSDAARDRAKARGLGVPGVSNRGGAPKRLTAVPGASPG